MTNKKLFKVFIICLLLLFLTACTQQSPAEINGTESAFSDSNTENTGLNALFGAKGAEAEKNIDIEKMLTYAIQDEYLAYEEYAYILESFGNQKPFSNIIKAEEKHIELLKPLFAEYNFLVPANTAIDYLVYPDNMKEALQAGVQAEIDNIAMYEAFLKEDLPEDIRAVFEELKNASENHLAAFEKNLENKKF